MTLAIIVESRIFKKHMGRTFSEYLVRLRMERAQQFLRDTDMTVREIADKVCCTNACHFIHSFRKEYSVTPAVFRMRKA